MSLVSTVNLPTGLGNCRCTIKDPTAIYGDKAKTESHDHAHTKEQVDVLAHLGQLMQERKQAEADTSYVASLYKKGINKILEKVGEESVETIIAAKTTLLKIQKVI